MVIFLIRGSYTYAFLVFIVAGISDALDGFLARILRQQTVLGSYLDPLADKALITTSFVALAILGAIPAWLAVIVISRDFIILLGILTLFIMSISVEMKPALVSKITTVLQIVTVMVVLMSRSFPEYAHYLAAKPFFWLTAAVTIISGFHYIRKGVQYVNSAPKNGMRD